MLRPLGRDTHDLVQVLDTKRFQICEKKGFYDYLIIGPNKDGSIPRFLARKVQDGTDCTFLDNLEDFSLILYLNALKWHFKAVLEVQIFPFRRSKYLKFP